MRERMVETLLQLGLIVNPEDVDNPGLLNTTVEEGSLKIVEDLLKYGADVNMLVDGYSTGLTPLHTAVKGKQVEMAKLLVYYGANVNVKDGEGKTPLDYAIENGDTKMTELLLNNGIDIEEDPNSLCIAVEKGSLKFAEDLLEYGADVHMFISSSLGRAIRLLHLAVHEKQVEMAKLLINYGVNVNDKDMWRRSPIDYAIEKRDTKMTELLLINGADIKKDPKVLFTAVEQGNLKIVEDLLKDGANVNMIDKSEYIRDVTLLHSAVKGKEVEMAKLLIKYGARVNAKDYDGITPLGYAIENRDIKITELLLNNGIDIKEDPNSLCIAVEKGSLKFTEDLLKHGADVNMFKRPKFGRCYYPLHCAVHGKHVEIANLLIIYGANVNVKDSYGITPIVFAIKERDTKMIDLLLINGADIKKDPKVLFTAVEQGNLKIVEDLLKDGADVNMIDESEYIRDVTLLHTAVQGEQVEIVKLLINYGAYVNVKDGMEKTPLSYAIEKRDTKMTELLLINGADIKEDLRALYTAVKNGNLKIVEDLLKDGADANMIDDFTKVLHPLHAAVKRMQVKMAKLLINYGANVNVKDMWRRSPIDYAIEKRDTKMTELLLINGADIKGDPKLLCAAVKKGCLIIVEALLKDGADVNMIDFSSSFIGGVTLLHYAALAEQVEMAKLLINYGANINVKDDCRRTPVGIAILKNNTEMTELLLINGADIKEDPRVLCTAVKKGSLKMVEDLLKDGADVNMIDLYLTGGLTLLHGAVKRKQVEMAKLLIKYGADVNAKDYVQTTPIVYAIKNRDTEMTELLLINGADIKEEEEEDEPYMLCTAVKNGSLKIAEYLLKDGANVNMIDRFSGRGCLTLLHSAVNGKEVEMAKLLIKYGADVNAKVSDGTTPLGYAIENRDIKLTELLLNHGIDIKEDPNSLCIAVEKGCLKYAEDLLKYGADVNMLKCSMFGRRISPLHCAVNGKHVEMAKLLINYGANVNVKDDEGITPIVDAIRNTDTKMTELLLINGADIKEYPEVLFTAVEEGSLKIAEYLLKDGANVNMIDRCYGRGSVTLLHIAVLGKQVEMAKLLISFGADVDVGDCKGQTPIGYAIENGDTEMTELLLINGADIKKDPWVLCTNSATTKLFK